jgi:hypothetical protein
MRTLSRCIAISICFCAPEADARSGLAQASFGVRWSVGVPSSLATGTARTYRLFDEGPALDVDLLITNFSPETLWVDHQRVSSALRLQVQHDGMNLDVTSEWLPLARLSGQALPKAWSAGEPVLLERDKGVSWTLRVLRTDGKGFGAGIYQIMWFMDSVGVFSTPDGRPVPGPPPLVTDLTVQVQPPASPSELALMWRAAGIAALERQDRLSALEFYARAAAADPTDFNREKLSGVYLSLARYEEALQILQELWPRYRGDRNSVPRMLAEAYIGLGASAAAEAVLRAARFPEEIIGRELDDVRRHVERRRP